MLGASAVSDGRPDENHRRMLWMAGPPAPSSAPAAILGEIMEGDDPLEPLERAARGLMEAFADPQVRAVDRSPRIENGI